MHYCTRFAGTLLAQAIYVLSNYQQLSRVRGQGYCSYALRWHLLLLMQSKYRVPTYYLCYVYFYHCFAENNQVAIFCCFRRFLKSLVPTYLEICSESRRPASTVHCGFVPKTAFLSRRISAPNCFFCTKKICCALFLRVPVIHWYSTGSAPLC